MFLALIACDHTARTDDRTKTIPTEKQEVVKIDKFELKEKYKIKITVILQNVFNNNLLEPLSEENENDLENNINIIKTNMQFEEMPSWMQMSFETISRLNPRGGWLSELKIQYRALQLKIDNIKNNINSNSENYVIASRLYLKRQFADYAWEIVIVEPNYTGNAVFIGSQSEVNEKHLENRIINNISLEYTGKQPVQYARFNNNGPSVTTTEYYRVYKTSNYNLEEENQNLTLLETELQAKEDEIKEAEKSIREYYSLLHIELEKNKTSN